MNCRCCQSEEIKKFGSFSNRNRLVQRYQCLRCGKTFSESQPLAGVRVASDKAAMVVQMLCEGVGVRAAGRLAGVNRNTVLNILETAGQHCGELLNARLVNLKVSSIEIDEVFGFVNCLEMNTDPDDPKDQMYGDQYVFLGMERTSKLIVHYEIGKRNSGTTNDFLRGLKARIDGRFQLTSDGFADYCGVNYGWVKQIFGEQVDYGIEIKKYGLQDLFPKMKRTRETPAVLQWCKRRAVIGNPDMSKVTVNHMERANLSVRLFNRRFTRKTLGYSKCLRNHRLAVALQIAHFNFCRVHSAHGKTPAMAAGLADHVWTVAELLAMAV
jgi:transposase-like protein/IS1 family transposase